MPLLYVESLFYAGDVVHIPVLLQREDRLPQRSIQIFVEKKTTFHLIDPGMGGGKEEGYKLRQVSFNRFLL